MDINPTALLIIAFFTAVAALSGDWLVGLAVGLGTIFVCTIASRVDHGDAAIACHKTLPLGGGWGTATKQCRGAAIFRENVCKSPRNPSIVTGPADRETVFASNAEFIAHHRS